MREIKFRGRRIDNDEWIYGSLLDGDIIVSGRVEADDEYIGIEEWCFVKPETVGQYTGLSDKNGKEIYEGDILRFTFDEEDSIGKTYDEIFTVEWNDRNLQFEFGDNKFHPMGTHQGKYTIWTMSHMSYETEVVGNEWDNPELLGGEPE